MASVKITIDNICAVSTGHHIKIQPQWRGARYPFTIPVCLNYRSVTTKLSLLFPCRTRRNLNRQRGTELVFLWTRLHMLSTLKRSLEEEEEEGEEEEEEEEEDKRKKEVNRVSVSFCGSIRAFS